MSGLREKINKVTGGVLSDEVIDRLVSLSETEGGTGGRPSTFYTDVGSHYAQPGEFEFIMVARCALPPEKIWPDGDAPDNPKVSDVIKTVEGYTNAVDDEAMWEVWNEWNLFWKPTHDPGTCGYSFLVVPGGSSATLVDAAKNDVKKKIEEAN